MLEDTLKLFSNIKKYASVSCEHYNGRTKNVSDGLRPNLFSIRFQYISGQGIVFQHCSCKERAQQRI